MGVLIDSSVWISYFREGTYSTHLDYLMDENLVLTNEVILAELVPFLKIKNRLKLIKQFNQMKQLPLEIDWADIIDMQTKCLKNGLSGIGIVDLMIAQNAISHQVPIFSEDKHFFLLQKVSDILLYP